jgi:hypothetical protein
MMIPCPKILCTIPVYKAVEALPYMTHLLFSQETGKAEAAGKYKARMNVGGPGVRTPIVRNGAVAIALHGKADYLFFLDDDMLVPPDIIEKLLSMDVPIACPIFFRSGDNNSPLVYDIDPGSGKPDCILDYPVDQVFEAPGGCGTGTMLIRRDVLESLESPQFFYPPDTRYGMDLLFCRRAREKGFATYCDSRILVQQMNNPQPVGLQQWLERKAEYEQAKGPV